jgi:hypothetical protein
MKVEETRSVVVTGASTGIGAPDAVRRVCGWGGTA